MNERFLFRGKRLDNDEWVQGSLLQYHDFYGKYTVAIAERFIDVPSISRTDPIFEKVDPKTLGQCTDLRDTKGKIAFEGDIIKCKYGTTEIKTVVVFEYAMFRAGNISLCTFMSRFEILGNVHDNPKLLEV